MTTTTTEPATRSQIEALRAEAAAAGDDEQVALALAALVEGPACFAWRQCEIAIDAARAMDDEVQS